MRKLIIASHSMLAKGMKDTLDFLSGHAHKDISVLTAYMDNEPVEKQVEKLMKNIPDNDEIIIFTDLASGSVNQKFFLYHERPHTHIISGMNLPVVMGVALTPDNVYLTADHIRELIREARKQLIYVNDMQTEMSDEDE